MRHAFLIMAHGNWEVLQRLVKKLDHEDNDIFLHIDKKVHFPKEVESELFGAMRSSKLYMAKRIRVNWGGYSLIQCELRLLEMAFREGCYHYFHLLSGVDFPIKTMEEINSFFEANNGYEFVDIEPDEWTEHTVWQFRYYHPLQEIIGRKGSRRYPSFFIEYYLLKLQKRIGVDRRKKYKDIEFKRGPQWFSVTNEFVEYMLSMEQWIKEAFGATKCSDEMVVPTLVYNSNFVNKQKPCLRYIDWTRGNPYVFTMDELDEIKTANALFVRKVGCETAKQKLLLEALDAI